MSLTSTPLWALCHLALKHPLVVTCGIGLGVIFLEEKKPVISITFDDGISTIYDHALPYMQEKNMVGTIFVNTETIDTVGHMTTPNLKEFVSLGWEVGSHGHTHSDMTTLTQEQLVYDLSLSVQNITDMTGIQPKTFATPYGSFNDDVIKVASEYFDYHLNAWSDANGITTYENYDAMNIHRIDVANSSPEEICNIVSGLENGDWFTIIMHDITDEPGKWNTSHQDFQKIIDCIHGSGIQVKTVTDVLEKK